MKNRISSRLYLCTALLAVLAVCFAGCGGSDGPTKPPTVVKPDITSFTGLPTDIAPGDSVLFSYVVTGADSLKLFPSGQKLTVTTTGSLYVKPDAVTLYTLRAYNKSGQDSAFAVVSMSTVVPSITQLVANEDTIVVNDSTQVTWVAVRSDSVKLNGGARIMPGTGGTIWYHPPTNGNLTLIAYNQYGTDTAIGFVRIEVPFAVRTASSFRYFTGEMGSNIQAPPMQFEVVNFQSAQLYKVWMKFSLLEGDGTLSADSLQAGPSGFANLFYDFDGNLGHAVVRAMIPGIDTFDVLVRANTIIPGDNFQGQYVMRGDTYEIVHGYYGTPISVDTGLPTQSPFMVANYEALIGLDVVFMDADNDRQLDNNELVNDQYLDSTAIILNDNGTIDMTARTIDGIGVGSQLFEIRNVYGSPDGAFNDPADTLVIYYLSQGLIFYCGTNPIPGTQDTVVGEIHIRPPQ